MGAREKLNLSYFTGSLILASVCGGLAGSWTIFVAVLVVLLVLNVVASEIRPRRHHNRYHGRD